MHTVINLIVDFEFHRAVADLSVISLHVRRTELLKVKHEDLTMMPIF